MSFFSELKRRNVFKVGIAYAIVAWLLIQVTSTVAPALHLPDWTLTFIVYLTIIGFPLALFLAWAFELTPEGIKATTSEGPDQYHTQTTGQRLNYFIIGILVLAVVFLVVDNYVLKEPPAVVGKTPGTTTVTETAAPEKHNEAKPEPTAPPNSIAVLPFENLSSDQEQDYFADGLTEELLNKLAQIQKLQVAARTSSFYFKGKNVDMREIGEMLGVAYLLEGSVRKSGNTLRITAQLNNAATGYHLWSETYDRTLDEIFTVQDEIATAVVKALEISLGVAELSHLPGMTKNVRAYDAFLKGRAIYDFTPDKLASAIKFTEEAVRLDPDFGLAWSRLAALYTQSPVIISGGLMDWEAKRDQAAARARELVPDSPYVLMRLVDTSISRVNWIEADRLYDKIEAAAVRYGVSNDYLVERATFLMELGRCRESLEIHERARARDPLNEDINALLADIYSKVGDLQAALAEVDRGLALGSTSVNLRGTGLLVALALHDRAEIEKRYSVMSADDVIGLPMNTAMITLLDDEKTARETLRGWLTKEGYQTPFHKGMIAQWAAYYGDPELALNELRSIPGQTGLKLNMAWRPIFKDIRKLPGFKELMRETGVANYWRTTGNWGDFCHPVGDDDFVCE